MTAISYLLLALFMAGICLWLWRLRYDRREGARGALVASLVGLLLGAASALLLGLGQWGLGNEGVEQAQRIMGLAAQHMSLPLLGLASLYLARGLQWKPAVWGQIILALMAFYELSRYLQWQAGYQWLVNLAGLVALGIAGWLSAARDKRIPLLCLVAWVGLLMPTLLGDGQMLHALLDGSQQASWLIPGFVAAGLAVGLLAEQAHNGPSDIVSNDQKTATRS